MVYLGIRTSRHVEDQVLADEHRNAITSATGLLHAARHQKIIERRRRPSSAREGQGSASCAEACRKINYRGRHLRVPVRGRRVLHEMNTRAGRAPVTEMITGTTSRGADTLAAGERLKVAAGRRTFGHPIECRINAEDLKFTPSRAGSFPVIPGGRASAWTTSTPLHGAAPDSIGG
jgi:biotin carboxylase